MTNLSLAALNDLPAAEFVAKLAGVFEHSPWVAENVVMQRPFASRQELHTAMVTEVQNAGREPQLALIRAHPDLAGKAAVQGTLTTASTEEQASAGLTQCTAEELATIQELNRAYQAKFGFPFIMAVKGRNKREILQAFRARLEQSPAQEFEQALTQIAKIAEFRLADLIEPDSEIMARLEQLARFSEDADGLTRTYLTPQHKAAGEQIKTWMVAAGMQADFDAVCNVVGRYEGHQPDLPALLLGSHFDTVRNAGKYDGALGIITAIDCVQTLHQNNERLPFAIEVIAFGDEEGVRFDATLLGSQAIAGTFDTDLLNRADSAGVTMQEAIHEYGVNPTKIASLARKSSDVLAFVELHIEQGPVLEAEDLPVGIVTAIAGASRFKVNVIGQAGHAGTVPMSLRRDAATAAAEAILFVEDYCRQADSLVGTVGQLQVVDGAINVIPGCVEFSLDIRAADDAQRSAAVAAILAQFDTIGKRRQVRFESIKNHDAAAASCASWLMQQLEAAIIRAELPPRRLLSGAGHDAMAIAALTDIAMLFVRCGNGGISHNPAETMTAEDADISTAVLLDFIRHFQPKQ